jgi:hypothetical protein
MSSQLQRQIIEDTIHNVIAAKVEFKRFLGKVRKRQRHYPKYLKTFKVDKGLHIKEQAIAV